MSGEGTKGGGEGRGKERNEERGKGQKVSFNVARPECG